MYKTTKFVEVNSIDNEAVQDALRDAASEIIWRLDGSHPKEGDIIYAECYLALVRDFEQEFKDGILTEEHDSECKRIVDVAEEVALISADAEAKGFIF